MSKLQDDLMQDFKDQKAVIYKQLEVFDPLGTMLSKPAAQRLVNKGVLILAEILCYLMSAASIAFAVFMNKVYPFYILDDLQYKPEFAKLDWMTLRVFVICIYALLGIIALLFYGIGRAMRQIRLKNKILGFAAKHIKTLVGQHLRRKASIDAIEQRHFLELPDESYDYLRVNDVPNPGYDGEAKT